MSLQYTPVEEIEPIHHAVHACFATGKTRDVAYRKRQLEQLRLMLRENEKAFKDALVKDHGRHPNETDLAELNAMDFEIGEAIAHVKGWAKPQRVTTTLPWMLSAAKINWVPKGAVLVIGVWNYPITLQLGPLVGAIAAGNTAVLKTAEQAPAVAQLLTDLFPKYLDSRAYKVVNGAIAETTELLRLKWDHIFYTGSGPVGKIIAKAAAEHLTPITLELGGKSPAVVFDDADMVTSARRIAWGKFVNAGQTCIAPDYVIVSKRSEQKFIDAFKTAMDKFTVPTAGNSEKGGMMDNKGYANIINDNHFNRVKKLLDSTHGHIVYGGNTDPATRKIEVTLVTDVDMDDALMEGEIFGPILPMVVVDDMSKAVKVINERDQPLALYVFTQNKANRDLIFGNTRSGGFVQNDVLVHFLVPGLPFGGTGPSGSGNYHGRKSFETFSHERASAAIPTWLDFALAARYPPYTSAKIKQLKMLLGLKMRTPAL